MAPEYDAFYKTELTALTTCRRRLVFGPIRGVPVGRRFKDRCVSGRYILMRCAQEIVEQHLRQPVYTETLLLGYMAERKKAHQASSSREDLPMKTTGLTCTLIYITFASETTDDVAQHVYWEWRSRVWCMFPAYSYSHQFSELSLV